ncbi:MAG: Holliday junction branch migration protein RuvA [Candidatus Omnitrophica bacterium]|nr:Holliday junction branch migration protein RuvA [Candidatus Omnitrophota bacterium]
MYEYLSGRLVEKNTGSLILDVGGVGYAVTIPLSTFESLPPLGQSVKILTFFVVREDAQALYGFLSESERSLFKMLLSISGIGPKMAITVLSGLTLPDLKRAIVDGSVHLLTGISGVGKKTAERIIIELREKLVLDERRMPESQASSAVLQEQDGLFQDSLQALIQLGYKKQNAKEAIQKALKNHKPEDLSAEVLVRESLKYV